MNRTALKLKTAILLNAGLLRAHDLALNKSASQLCITICG